ncbi:hypothetical protein [Aurantiacibacter gangjinensis]|uniref:Uncharacterized protein n=1 Tax=Aurantiacibacter gangjinensis TaxID=502682 RepID=A0A0G9MS07_9SPHN|nr:hypothetical protein [Aurantiacibacter gangjinensis]APE26854.1 D-glycerate 3-kinase, plant type [Aurantiacibacter gangjinensis]KLE33329.1 hypothetical protein AAW01_05130 [Aurantiacibacter gangjinensis]
MTDPIDTLIAEERLPADYRDVVERHWTPLATQIARRAAGRTPLIVGINGAQGTGKSTVCRFLEILLKKRGLRAVTLSIDDIYLAKSQRQQLAAEVHPLFATRGVPGTHAPGFAFDIIEAVLAGRTFEMPRFEKSRDDRAKQGVTISGPVDVLLFEGWCVGAKPQPEAALAEPVNALEAEEDPDLVWRSLVNMWLGADYARLFAQLDMLIMLKVADFDAVRRNRALQEAKLREREPDAPGLMSDEEVQRFLDLDERLTLHMLEEMPQLADIVIPIGPDQRPVATGAA